MAHFVLQYEQALTVCGLSCDFLKLEDPVLELLVEH